MRLLSVGDIHWPMDSPDDQVQAGALALLAWHEAFDESKGVPVLIEPNGVQTEIYYGQEAVEKLRRRYELGHRKMA